MHDTFDPILNEEHYTALVGISRPTAQRQRSDGTGPPFVQLSERRIGYRQSYFSIRGNRENEFASFQGLRHGNLAISSQQSRQKTTLTQWVRNSSRATNEFSMVPFGGIPSFLGKEAAKDSLLPSLPHAPNKSDLFETLSLL